MSAGKKGDLERRLEELFGFSQFLPGQRQVIETLLAGRSAAAVFPTGGGKSLCYQLPALLLEGVTLVVSPLIALMKDQIDALARRGHPAARLDSSLEADEYRGIMEDLRRGDLRLLYVAPERFNNERFREALKTLKIALFAVDEAHCISEWGHNFRPDYLKLVRFAKQCEAQRVLALTATATPEVLGDICTRFEVAPTDAVRIAFHRPNLSLLATATTPGERDALLVERLRATEPGPTIVYVTLQRTAEEVAERLAIAGFSARAYHAGMPADTRDSVQEWFFADPAAIVVATIAFGMGIDKADIRSVVHYNLAKSLENYSQEVGRAGRDGLEAECATLLCGEDLCVLENFVYGDTPTLRAVTSLLQQVFAEDSGVGDSAHELDVAYQQLAAQTDIRVLVVRTLLTVLELEGYLEGGTPYYSSFRFKPLASSQEILDRFEGPRREFLRGILRHSEKARTWFTVDVDRAAVDLRSPRARVVRALDYLGELGLLELQAQGVRHRYRVLRRPEQSELGLLAEDLYERCCQREQAELERLHQVVGFLCADCCQAAVLCEHFGERLAAACGKCSWCRSGGEALALPPASPPDFDEPLWHRALGLREEHEVLGPERNFARFLCGVGSPHLSKARLARHELFGAFADTPFAEILERAGE